MRARHCSRPAASVRLASWTGGHTPPSTALCVVNALLVLLRCGGGVFCAVVVARQNACYLIKVNRRAIATNCINTSVKQYWFDVYTDT